MFVPQAQASDSFLARTGVSGKNSVEVQPWDLDSFPGQLPSMTVTSRYQKLAPFLTQVGNDFEDAVGTLMEKRYDEQLDTWNTQMYTSCESARVSWLADLPQAKTDVQNYEPKAKYQDGYFHGIGKPNTKVHIAPFGGIAVTDFDEDWEAMGLTERVGRSILNMITSPDIADSEENYFGEFDIQTGLTFSGSSTCTDAGCHERLKAADSQSFFQNFFGNMM